MTLLSQSICRKDTTRIARIADVFEEKFRVQSMPCTGIQDLSIASAFFVTHILRADSEDVRLACQQLGHLT
jgi:hypothetical protein